MAKYNPEVGEMEFEEDEHALLFEAWVHGFNFGTAYEGNMDAEGDEFMQYVATSFNNYLRNRGDRTAASEVSV